MSVVLMSADVMDRLIGLRDDIRSFRETMAQYRIGKAESTSKMENFRREVFHLSSSSSSSFDDVDLEEPKDFYDEESLDRVDTVEYSGYERERRSSDESPASEKGVRKALGIARKYIEPIPAQKRTGQKSPRHSANTAIHASKMDTYATIIRDSINALSSDSDDMPVFIPPVPDTIDFPASPAMRIQICSGDEDEPEPLSERAKVAVRKILINTDSSDPELIEDARTETITSTPTIMDLDDSEDAITITRVNQEHTAESGQDLSDDASFDLFIKKLGNEQVEGVDQETEARASRMASLLQLSSGDSDLDDEQVNTMMNKFLDIPE